MTSLVIASARRVFCCSDLPGQSFTTTCGMLVSSHSSLVLLVGDLFHPINSLSVDALLNGNVCHGCCCGCTMPVLFARRKPDHITRMYLFDRSSFTLHPAAT